MELNLKSETADKLIDGAKGFLQSILKPSIDELGLLIADKVKLWRFNNQVNNLNKVKEKVKKAGFEPKQLNPKVLFPYLEGIALEGDDEMQESWADLMTNYLDPEMNLEITVYPLILSQLTMSEIRILRFLDLGFMRKEPSRNETLEFSTVNAAAFFNLVRLGLVDEDEAYSIEYPDESNLMISIDSHFLTNFGYDFAKAIHRKLPKEVTT
jgi:hypothetical protein